MTSSRRPNARRQLIKPLLAASLAVGGVLNMVGIVLADGTAAGTAIENTATATYNDPNDPDAPLTSTSNTVTVSVAEVAGITVSAAGVDDLDGGTVDANDDLYFRYTITNVGNDTTDFRVPSSADIQGPGTLTSGAAIQVSYDGGTTWIDVPSGGLETDPIVPGGSVQVRVPITVNAVVSPTDVISVQLGNTPGDGQNQPFVGDGGDVFTVDSDDPPATPGEVVGAPVNGVREASATQTQAIDSAAITKALVTIEKVMSNHQRNDLSIITDDQITYDLSFTVESSPPLGSGVNAGPLLPQGGISVAASGAAAVPDAYILVSDAVPAGTTFVSATAPSGWTPVYTDETPSATEDATDLTWYEDVADIGGAANVTRAGFINAGTVTSVAPNVTVQTFRITVVSDQVTNPSAVIGNIAQVFGSSVADDPSTTGTDESNDPTNTVADESGDQNPSNYNTDTNIFDPPSDGELPDGNGDDIPDDIDPTDPTAGDGTDPSNNNTGTGPGGEANILALAVAPPAGVLNGPDNAPDASGPTDNNDDFTNRSTNVPDTTPGATNDPSPVNFTNSVENNGQATGDVLLIPTPPDDPNELPANTTVTIVGPGTSGTATYTWSGSEFTTTDTPVVVTGVAPGDIVDYGVEVDLPANTPLSTDATTADAGPEDADGRDEPG
ncbi:MAG: hypothetical protein AAF766_22475, partial [Cyanobacteria bacterium P01_D01_bin.14]